MALVPVLRLLRPANIVTAVADILAGIAISGFFAGDITIFPVILLILSTIGLYGGGVIMNDVFDAALDRVERPERPIPSGQVTKKQATILGIVFLLGGIIAAGFVHENFFSISTIIAITIAVAALVYDKWGKHHPVLGPINMGLCRGLNLLLGISIIPEVVSDYWQLSIVPLIYIAAITMVSRGEVHGGKKKVLFLASVLYGLVIAIIVTIAIGNHRLVKALPFIITFGIIVLVPLFKAIDRPIASNFGKAVKFGVLGLIAMNAAWAASFDYILTAVVIILMLPLSIGLARLFAVT